MLLRFLGRICGDAVGSAARRLHVHPQHRSFAQFRAERGFYAGVCSEAAGSARRLRKNVEDEAERLRRRLWAQRKRILDAYLTLHAVNCILKFPAPEPEEIKEFAAEETLKEDAMKWRFEQYLMTEHGCKYKTEERYKVWLFNMFKECALDVENRNAEGGGAIFGAEQFWDETEQEFRRRRELKDN